MKTKLIFILLILLALNEVKGQTTSPDNYFQFNGFADVRLRCLERGAGGRAIVAGSNNSLVFNFDGDFTGGTLVQSALSVSGKLTSRGFFLNNSNNGSWLNSFFEYPGNALIIRSSVGASRDCALDFLPGGADGKILSSRFNMYIATGANKSEKKVQIHTSGISYFNGGNIGIGTETPQAKLDVRGKVIADEVEIKVNKGADFVFQSDYDLISLSNLETFIHKNNHLPDIPSEKEMIDNGVNVNEMQIKLLQKIEELTLYTIELNKQVQNLKTENQEIKKQLNRKN